MYKWRGREGGVVQVVIWYRGKVAAVKGICFFGRIEYWYVASKVKKFAYFCHKAFSWPISLVSNPIQIKWLLTIIPSSSALPPLQKDEFETKPKFLLTSVNSYFIFHNTYIYNYVLSLRIAICSLHALYSYVYINIFPLIIYIFIFLSYIYFYFYLFVTIYSQWKLAFIKIKSYLVKYITIFGNSLYEIAWFFHIIDIKFM